MAAGSEVSDDAASWETVNDDEMDTLENAQEVCLVFFFFFFSILGLGNKYILFFIWCWECPMAKSSYHMYLIYILFLWHACNLLVQDL